MEGEAIRPAGPADLSRCTELLAAALAEIDGRRGAGRLVAGLPSDPAALVERWTPPEAAALLVGTYDDAVVGLAAGRVVDGSPPTGSIECCYVEPDARQMGVGRLLIDGLLEWFNERGCLEVDAAALPGDRLTKQLFEAAGFKARLVIMSRAVDPTT
jgi:ribosomal protein S18 acetylase RimI-like enzyme